MSQPAPSTPALGAIELATAARQVQLRIRAQLVRDIAASWAGLNFSHLSRTWPAWLQAMTGMLNRYHALSADQAGLFYRASRQAAIGEAGDAALVKLAAQPVAQWIERALGYAGPGVYAKQIGLNRTPAVGEQHALTQVLGTASRVVLDGARTTVLETTRADDRAVGYYRVTDGAPCAFCALLASRGIVYKHNTVDFKTHNDCGCTGAPAFSKDQPLPEISTRAGQVYAARGPGAALPAFRKAWNAQQTSVA